MGLPAPILHVFTSRGPGTQSGPAARPVSLFSLILRGIVAIVLLVVAAVVLLPIAACVLLITLIVAGVIVAVRKAQRAWRTLTRRDGLGRQNVRVVTPRPDA